MKIHRLISASVVCFATALFASSATAAEPAVSVYEYKIGDVTYEGYFARPATPVASQPGVLVVHDWMGNGEFSRDQTVRLAKLGYIAFAVDMYGKGRRAANAGEAQKLSGELYAKPELFRERMLAALELLKKQPGVDATRLGAIGFCFGGTSAIELARAGADLKGVVTFHGGVKPLSATAPGAIKGHLLILHGALDPLVPPADLAACMTDLNAAHAYYQVIAYPESVHAFTNPNAGNDITKGAAYNPAAAKAAFAEMEAFFKDVFAK